MAAPSSLDILEQARCIADGLDHDEALHRLAVEAVGVLERLHQAQSTPQADTPAPSSAGNGML